MNFPGHVTPSSSFGNFSFNISAAVKRQADDASILEKGKKEGEGEGEERKKTMGIDMMVFRIMMVM